MNTPLWTLHDAAMRHARYYAHVLDQLRLRYEAGGESQPDALAAFDREQAQIDAAWGWLLAQALDPAVDDLLLLYGAASIDLGDLRYERQPQRVRHFEAMLGAARRRTRQRDEVVALANLASIYHDVSMFPAAMAHYDQAHEIAHTLDDPALEMAIITNQGRVRYECGEFQLALQHYEEALRIGHTMGVDDYALLGNLALVHAMLGQRQIADHLYTEACALAHAAGDLRAEGSLIGNMGLLATDQGRHADACRLHRQALALSRRLKDRHAEGEDLLNLGLALYALGNLEEAAHCFKDSYSIAADIGNRRGMAYALGNQGRVLVDHGELAAATPIFQATLDLATAIGDQKCHALALVGAAAINLREHHGEQAVAMGEQALAMLEGIGALPDIGQVLSLFGRAYLLCDQPRLAYAAYIRWYKQACVHQDELHRCEALLGAGGVAHRQGRYLRAHRHYLQSWQLARQSGAQKVVGMSLWNMGLLCMEMGRRSLALHCLRESLVIAHQHDLQAVDERSAYLDACAADTIPHFWRTRRSPHGGALHDRS